MEQHEAGPYEAKTYPAEPYKAEPYAAEAGEAEPLEAESFDLDGGAPDGAGGPLGRRVPPYQGLAEWLPVLGTLIIIALLLTVGITQGYIEWGDDDDGGLSSPPAEMVWDEPVMLERALNNPLSLQDHPNGVIGYEPSIAVDSQGNLYYTAHKDLAWETSWDYLASWFFVSQDGGESWGPPNDWGLFNQGSYWLGDEGDIGIDANDRVYFDDTTLADNWLHVWDDGGDDHVRSQPLGSSGLDDRPWLTAQGDGIVHYLGNWAIDTPDCQGQAGRYWYYRSDDGGLTFSQCLAFPGGWTHIEAERDGPYTYVVQEAVDTNDGEERDLRVLVSDDTGQTWSEPLVIGEPAANPPEGFPWISTGPASNDGLVAAIWADAYGGIAGPWRVIVAMSWDHGASWESWDITPFEGLFMYPTIYVGPERTVGVAFYGLEGTFEAGNQWHLYGAMVQDPEPGTPFKFNLADPEPLHTVLDFEVATDDFHALHDFFEIAIAPDLSLNIAYQRNVGQHPFEPAEEQRYLYFVKGALG